MATNWRQLRALGQTGLDVTGICIGTSPLASVKRLYGYDVDEERAIATVRAVFAGPFNFMDTSNAYGAGSAERRIGAAMRAEGGLPPGFVLATKVDAEPGSTTFTGDRVRRSVEESFERLGIERCQLMYLHDPEHRITFEQGMATGGPVEALLDLQQQGVLENIGIAAGVIEMMRKYVGTGVFQAVLSHNRHTLLDGSAEPLIEDVVARGMAFVNGAPYGGGMLVKGPDTQPRYAYRETPEAIRDAARGMQAACARHGVPLAAAALQFSLRDPRVTSTVLGFSEPGRVQETIDLAEYPIPEDLWPELEALRPPREFWLN